MISAALDQFKQTHAELRASRREPAWMGQLRDENLAQFIRLGWPTVREEAWRYTNPLPLSRIAFARPGRSGIEQAREALKSYALPEAVVLTFVDGRLSEALSQVVDLPAGMRVCSLSAFLCSNLEGNADAQLLTQRLKRVLGSDDAVRRVAFGELNAALFEDGALVMIPPAVRLERPIQLLFIDSGLEQRTAIQLRNVIIAGAYSKGVILEDHVSLDQGERLINSVSRVMLDDGAELELCRLQRLSDQAFPLSALEVEQTRDSRLTSHFFALGGALARDELHVRLAGEDASCVLNGLFIADGKRHIDHSTSIDHVQPRCSSEQLYKGILDEQAEGVFSGTIRVHRHAQKTDARQNSKNLLLSDRATINAKPQLEIFADDVKCTHGATIGHLDEDALFYLRTRGLDLPLARALLVQAFALEQIERISSRVIRPQLERALGERRLTELLGWSVE